MAYLSIIMMYISGIIYALTELTSIYDKIFFIGITSLLLSIIGYIITESRKAS